MTEWSLTLNDTKTGAFVAAFQPSESSWSTSLSGSGESTETIVVNDADNPWEPGQFTNLVQSHNRMIVRWWGDTPIYAHKINEYQYDLDKGTVTVSAQDLYTETNWRMIGGVDADKHLSLEIVGRNASGAVRQILARMMQWGPEWVYPIDLPADGAGDITAAWSFWQGYTINEILAEITRRTNVEIFLRVYRTSGRNVRFEALVGNPITLDAITLNMAAERLPISAITYTSHGVTQLTGLLGIGNGSGEDQESRWAGGGPFSIPIRDTKKSFRDLGGNGLQQATNSTLTSNLGPVKQWDVAAFTIDDEYGPDLALPGRVLNIETHEDPIIPTAVHALRVVRASGSNANQLKIEVQNA